MIVSKQDTKVERLHEPYAKIEKSWTLDNTVTIMVRRRNDAQKFLSNRQQGNWNFSQNFLHTYLPTRIFPGHLLNLTFNFTDVQV